MKLVDEQALRLKTAAIVLDWANDRQPPFRGETKADFAGAVMAAHIVADESRLGLHRWIDAARRAGMTWTEIGEALGITKQAAQQRFRALAGDDEMESGDDHEVVRTGATAFNEMRILREEGLNGNELVRAGALSLVFRRSGHPWEHSRVVAVTTGQAEAQMSRCGWTYVTSWFPFHYFKRPVALD